MPMDFPQRLLTTFRILSTTSVLMTGFGVVDCGHSATAPGSGSQIDFTFAQGSQGWTAGLSDYNVAMQDEMMFEADYRPIPPPFTTSALFMTSANLSDDAFMYYKGRTSGLSPNGAYTASFSVTIATDIPQGCSGTGGAPGESVYVKAGTSAAEPLAVLDNNGDYRMNIDKGNQAMGGANAVVLGNIADDLSCDTANIGVWRLKTLRSAPNAVAVRANADGSVWLMVGTDSGFEGLTSLYISEFDVTFQKMP